MPMTVVITSGVPDKYRGFLASCMLELAPGVYSHPKMSAGIRNRIADVLEKWYNAGHPDCSILMVWNDSSAPGGQGIFTLGLPMRTIIDCDGVLLSRLSEKENSEGIIQPQKSSNDV